MRVPGDPFPLLAISQPEIEAEAIPPWHCRQFGVTFALPAQYGRK
jgi:hypothetical protein